MSSLSRQYLFGLLFVALGVYYLVQVKDFLEFTLFALAGITFILNALTLEPKLIRYKKPLVIVTWILIGATGIFFLYILQFKFF